MFAHRPALQSKPCNRRTLSPTYVSATVELLSNALHLQPFFLTNKMLAISWSNPTIPPLLTFSLSMLCTLCVLAFPPRNRYLAFLLYFLPATHAFIHQLHITPWYSINDTLGRLLYIEAAYLSNVLLIEGWDPHASESGSESEGWKERFWTAGKVFYMRKLGNFRAVHDSPKKSEKCDDDSGQSAPQPSRLSFGIRHLLQAALCLIARDLLEKLFWPPHLDYDRALRVRLGMLYDICIADALWFTSLHTLTAALYVSVLQLDMPHEWTPLFGPPSAAYSVRRYWGVYWHDFIRESFSAHIKLFTRGWCGWVKASALRRVVENSAVFVVSGGMHALVIFVQTKGRGNMSCVVMWFAAQMLPIVVEGVVWDLWVRSGVRARVEGRVGQEGVVRVERGVGYVWVFGWMMWSVPLYLNTKERWEMEDMARRNRIFFDKEVEEYLTVDDN